MVPTLLCIACFCSANVGHTYFVSPQGSDSNSGLSWTQSWKTLDRVAKADLRPGDTVQLESGAVFPGPLSLPVGGDPEKPLVITSVGKPATIDVPDGPGVVIRTGGLELHNLILTLRSSSEKCPSAQR